MWSLRRDNRPRRGMLLVHALQKAVRHRVSVCWLPCLKGTAASTVGSTEGHLRRGRSQGWGPQLSSTREGHADGRVDMANGK